MKTSLWNKIKFYFIFRKIIKKNLPRLNGQFNLRKDNVNRLYTVLNLPEDVTIYGKDLIDKYITKYVSDVNSFCKEIGINELIAILDSQRIDSTNYLLVFGYAGFNTAKVANRIIYSSIFIIIASLIYYFFL